MFVEARFTLSTFSWAVAIAVMAAASAASAIPATQLMTVYQFNGPAELPYYDVGDFVRRGAKRPAGTLAQGTAVIPCLVLRNGEAVVDKSGTPFVGFEVLVDSRDPKPDSETRYKEMWEQRKSLRVANHHCPAGVRHVIDVRRLFALGKAPRFESPSSGEAEARIGREVRGDLDAVVRAFHGSRHCANANRDLLGRREALARAWDAFAADHAPRWPADTLTRARHLDYVMRTALYEGHIGRGCTAYGGCERNVVALSIRNRALESCQKGQGCGFPGDFQGVASKVSQYNIWDELLTQTSGLTGCFLRSDLATVSPYAKLRAMYEQTASDVERVLFGGDAGLRAVFPDNRTADLKRLRHYYHPPAMSPCFSVGKRLEYISGAVARRGKSRALLANTRIRVDQRKGRDYLFRAATIDRGAENDVVQLSDDYPGFVVDGRKVELREPTRCAPFGTPRGCRFDKVGRYRKVPPWLTRGAPLKLGCFVEARGEDCTAPSRVEMTEVGGVCDTEMQPVAGVR